MKQKNLYLCVGVPGSGKSYWVNNRVASSPNNSVVISRDAVRFSLVAETEEYFSREDEVFNLFVDKVNEAIASDRFDNIYVDATHITEKSRAKILKRLKLDNVKLIAVNFKIPLRTCLNQNNLRTGRAVVPQSVVSRMAYQVRFVLDDEGAFHYDEIIDVKENN